MDMQSTTQPTGKSPSMPKNGRKMAEMRFWDRAAPDLDPPLRERIVRSGTGWLDDAKVEPLGARRQEDLPVKVPWKRAKRSTAAPKLAARLGEMAASYEWEVPAELVDQVAQARAVLKHAYAATQLQQEQMVRDRWPDVWQELRLYEQRRLLAEAELGSWSYDHPTPWDHAQWKSVAQAASALERHMEEVNARSYVDGDDPFLHPRHIAGLDTFLSPSRRDYPTFRIS